MNWLDYVILGTLLLSTLVGVIRGVTREVLGLGTWVLATVAAYLFADELAVLLQRWIQDAPVRMLAAYAGVFAGSLAVGAVLTALLTHWIRESRLSSADRTLGGAFGLARAVVLVGAGVLLSELAEAQEAPWWSGSHLVEHFEVVGEAIAAVLPEGWVEALRPAPVEAPPETLLHRSSESPILF